MKLPTLEALGDHADTFDRLARSVSNELYFGEFSGAPGKEH